MSEILIGDVRNCGMVEEIVKGVVKEVSELIGLDPMVTGYSNYSRDSFPEKENIYGDNITLENAMYKCLSPERINLMKNQIKELLGNYISDASIAYASSNKLVSDLDTISRTMYAIAKYKTETYDLNIYGASLGLTMPQFVKDIKEVTGLSDGLNDRNASDRKKLIDAMEKYVNTVFKALLTDTLKWIDQRGRELIIKSGSPVPLATYMSQQVPQNNPANNEYHVNIFDSVAQQQGVPQNESVNPVMTPHVEEHHCTCGCGQDHSHQEISDEDFNKFLAEINPILMKAPVDWGEVYRLTELYAPKFGATTKDLFTRILEHLSPIGGAAC